LCLNCTPIKRIYRPAQLIETPMMLARRFIRPRSCGKALTVFPNCAATCGRTSQFFRPVLLLTPRAAARSFATQGAEPSGLTQVYAWWKGASANLKKLFVSYGYFAVATYLGVYVTTLSGLFVLVHAGLIPGPDVGAFINAWSVKKMLVGDDPVTLSPVVGEFLMAWLLTKTTEPVRLVVTIAAIPALVRRMPASILRAFRIPPDMWDPHYNLPKPLRRLRESSLASLHSSSPGNVHHAGQPGNRALSQGVFVRRSNQSSNILRPRWIQATFLRSLFPHSR
jgi:hypothetical protein